MFNLEVGFYICDTTGFLRIMYLVKVLLNLVRFAVPVILILMIALDLFKNVINPKEKEGMKKIVNRLTAGVIVFFVPTIVSLVLYLMDYVLDNESEDYKISSCYTNANLDCVNNIENYLKCEDVSDANKKECKEFRSCNSYRLGNGCYITTELDNINCKSTNTKLGSKYIVNTWKRSFNN